MMRNERANKLVILAGATGSGKTALITQLPKEIFEVVSFDSRQVYKFLELGTAKPTKEEREKILHHLIDFLEPTQTMNAKEFSSLAEICIQDIWARKKIPVLTVGT
ncbi:MAG: tRNA (adenosine(37)-N6)-dimethylallyltransferase MiaA, partial [Leptospiraceae bacterium]|nr:tRNA (adenosine(37)-N6)-dimethylallyltransferase MiaA [Leptospiraceae bacterium]